MKLTNGSKIRAARAILSLSRQVVANECCISASLLQRVENDESNIRSDIVGVVLSYFEKNGFFFSENSISINEFEIEKESEEMNNYLSNEEIIKSLVSDHNFNECYAHWDEKTRNNFFSVFTALHDLGLDMWYVNMNGEIRAGAKSPEDQKGKPFAFMKLKNEGFTFDWHKNISEYVNYIKKFPASFGHGTLVDAEFCDHLQEAVKAGAEVPPLMRSLSKRRIPSDYLAA